MLRVGAPSRAPRLIGSQRPRLPASTKTHPWFRSELLSAFRVYSRGRTRVQFCSERSGLQRLPIRPADGKSSHCRCSLPNCPIEALSWCWKLFVCLCPWPMVWQISSANWLWPGDFVVDAAERLSAVWGPMGLLMPEGAPRAPARRGSVSGCHTTNVGL